MVKPIETEATMVRKHTHIVVPHQSLTTFHQSSTGLGVGEKCQGCQYWKGENEVRTHERMACKVSADERW